MIIIDGTNADEILLELSSNEIQYKIALQMNESQYKYKFSSYDEFLFELNLRNSIVNASKILNNSEFAFATFRNVRVNTKYWEITRNGGMKLKRGISSSEAISDIHKNGHKYATECATAMVIVYFVALLEIYPPALFDDVFKDIYLMNWHYIHPLIREVGMVNKERDYFIADRRYFDNPQVDPQTPQWQGENVIDLGEGLYYGHGVGIKNADGMIRSLNRFRKPNATQSAYLLDSAGRPDFKNLYNVLYEYYN